MQDKKLLHLYHKYNANTVEGFNKFLTKLLLKDKMHCFWIENKTRSYLAAGLHSL